MKHASSPLMTRLLTWLRWRAQVCPAYMCGLDTRALYLSDMFLTLVLPVLYPLSQLFVGFHPRW